MFLKEGMWGVGLIILAIFGILLINLFGSITVTNQQDYTAMKNTVEAAMYDAIDMGLYRSGFCVCSNISRNPKGKWVFESSDQYSVLPLKSDSCVYEEYNDCERIDGEYVIDKKVFAESLVRRFAESVRSNYDYQIIVEDVIEYPPKVSVNVRSSNKYEFGEGNDDYTIDNKIDAILEMNTTVDVVNTVDDECVIDDITCDADGKCRDSHGKLCFEKEKTTSDKCVSDISCSVHGYSISCYDASGNYCGGGSVPKPNITVPNVQIPKETVKNIYGGGCFLKGTKVVTKDGYRDIDKLKAGDYVLTYNEEDGINEYKKIAYVFELKNINEVLYTIKTDDTEIKVTSEHNVYIIKNENRVYTETVEAQKLKKGDTIIYADGTYHKIIEIEKQSINQTVYNLEIEDGFNFYVGDKGILVYHAKRVEDVHGEMMTVPSKHNVKTD